MTYNFRNLLNGSIIGSFEGGGGNIDFVKSLPDAFSGWENGENSTSSRVYYEIDIAENPGSIFLVADRNLNYAFVIVAIWASGESGDFYEMLGNNYDIEIIKKFPHSRQWFSKSHIEWIPLSEDFNKDDILLAIAAKTRREETPKLPRKVNENGSGGFFYGQTSDMQFTSIEEFNKYCKIDNAWFSGENLTDYDNIIEGEFGTVFYKAKPLRGSYYIGRYHQKDNGGLIAHFSSKEWLNWTCFIKGQLVTLADGSQKPIEEIQPGDIVKYITDSGNYAETEVVLPPKMGYCEKYNKYSFDDDTTLSIYESQGIWHEGNKKYQDILTFKVGDKTKKLDGSIITLTSIEEVICEEPIEHYFLFTYNGNYTVNNILTCTDRLKAFIELCREGNKEYRDRLGEEKMRLLNKQIVERFNRKNLSLGHQKLIRIEAKVKDQINELNFEISKIQKKLHDTDYQVIKFVDGALSEEEYEPIKLDRIKWRAEINEKEGQIADITKYLNGEQLRVKNRPSRPYYPAHTADTKILMADGSEKIITDVKAGDLVSYESDGAILSTQVVLPPIEEYVWDAVKYTLANGIIVVASDDQNPFCEDYSSNRSPMEFTVGDSFKLADGTYGNIAMKEEIKYQSQQSFYRLVTASGGYVVNNIPYQVEQSRIENELSWEENEYYALNQ